MIKYDYIVLDTKDMSLQEMNEVLDANGAEGYQLKTWWREVVILERAVEL